MADSLCPLCGEAVLTPLLKLHIQLEKSMMREMKETHPAQASDREDCKQCSVEYKRKHARVREEAREIRSRTEASLILRGGEGQETDGEDDNY